MAENNQIITVKALLHDMSILTKRAGINEFEYPFNADDSDLIISAAEKITSGADKNSQHSQKESEYDPLRPVFNVLNKHNYDRYYSSKKLIAGDGINYPIDEKSHITKEQYSNICKKLECCIKNIRSERSSVEELLNEMEKYLSFIPFSCSFDNEDVSFYDHAKLTASVAVCLNEYLEQNKDFLNNTDEINNVPFMRLASLDISGIQKFIYTITSKKALRTLRARSFYLEILMEHMIDELLTKLGLNRANVIYSGGGHCYLLIPNVQKSKYIFEAFIKETNSWFLKHFGIQLFVAGSSSECSSDMLKNIPEGSYSQLFRNVSRRLSAMKNSRYSPEQIIELNEKTFDDYSSECKVCRHVGHVNKDGVCEICAALEEFSGNVLYADYFTVLKGEKSGMLPLPGGYSLRADSDESILKRITNDKDFVRTYGKNKDYAADHTVKKLYVGSYTTGDTFERFAKDSKGINRVGILRADVDNLGTAFVSGFNNPENHNKYLSLSRVASFSRQLSMFFKYHINEILENGSFSFDGSIPKKRDVTIIYSGGDDVFIVGAWNDIICTAVDLRHEFERFTEGTLTISAGIGIYDDKYPISASAVEVEKMVDTSKSVSGKNAVTLLEDGVYHTETVDGEKRQISDGTYKWAEFEDEVINEKYRAINEYFGAVKLLHGNSLLYRILELISSQKDRVNFARYVYLLARLEPESNSSNDIKNAYIRFKNRMVSWINEEKDRRQLKTAIEIYVYLNREQE